MNYQTPGWRAYALYRAKPVHVGHMIRMAQAQTGKLFDRNPRMLQDKIDWLNDNFSADTLDHWHKRISDGYKTHEFAKRGRAFASPNKSIHANPPPLPAANGHAQSATTIDTAELASQFVTKAVFDNHDTSNDNFFKAIQTKITDLTDSLAAAHGAAKAAFDKANSIHLNTPTIVHIQPIDAPTIDMGVQHNAFPTLLNYCRAVRAIWMYGPAGTGKSMACENVAKALGREFRTNGKLSEDVHLLGYKDAMGIYRSTHFRDAYENGHIYCADEIDGWLPDALIALNNALANGHCAFPDKIVPRHPDFIFIGAANTTGKGGTIEYVARFQHDAAFLDRFVTLEFSHDNGLEDYCVSNKTWLKRVRYVRDRCANQSTIKNHLITMRAAIYGEKLLAAGIEQEQVEKSTLRKGLTDAQWALIK